MVHFFEVVSPALDLKIHLVISNLKPPATIPRAVTDLKVIMKLGIQQRDFYLYFTTE